jgi:hypothetical protein
MRSDSIISKCLQLLFFFAFLSILVTTGLFSSWHWPLQKYTMFSGVKKIKNIKSVELAVQKNGKFYSLKKSMNSYTNPMYYRGYIKSLRNFERWDEIESSIRQYSHKKIVKNQIKTYFPYNDKALVHLVEVKFIKKNKKLTKQYRSLKSYEVEI